MPKSFKIPSKTTNTKQIDQIPNQKVAPWELPPIWRFDFDQDYQPLVEYVSRLEFIENKKNLRTKQYDLLDHDVMKELKQFCLICCQHYQAEVRGSTHKILLEQSWANLANKGDSHHQHFHPNSYLSGVFYLKNDANTRIKFHNNTLIEKYFWSQSPVIDLDGTYPANMDTVSFPAPAGCLMVFCSRICHSVEIQEADTPRLSLSFNTSLERPYGDENGLTLIK
tara:strand:- start:83 stop:754 length:672 start_codon:yes stop_codon:yes gene_type:complete